MKLCLVVVLLAATSWLAALAAPLMDNLLLDVATTFFVLASTFLLAELHYRLRGKRGFFFRPVN